MYIYSQFYKTHKNTINLMRFKKPDKRIWKISPLVAVMFFLSDIIYAEEPTYSMPDNDTDSVASVSAKNNKVESSVSLADHFRREPRFLHQLAAELRPAYVIPSISFLEGDNSKGKPIDKSYSAHLKYSFKFTPGSCIDKIYGGVYQGIGLAYYNFFEPRELGNPLAVYLFQGARIARISPRVSLNYEWNFGVSFGWEPYNFDYNWHNTVIGSKVNAYLNANFYFNFMLSPLVDLVSGITLTHFSNGNTKFPNAGLNTTGLKVGLIYNFNRHKAPSQALFQPPPPAFERYISYDLVLFGAWRRKGVMSNGGEEYVASPHSYTVAGFNFSPMYNFNYRFRAGVSLDGYYDGSANVYKDYEDHSKFATPPLKYQTALGLSARAEYVMPYFSVNLGLGTNVLHSGGDLTGLYQILALKINVTRSSYLHIGYSLRDFHLPNFLMLGIGYRFNNKQPRLHR